MSVTYRISVQYLDFTNKVGGELKVVSFTTRRLPCDIVGAMEMAKDLGEISVELLKKIVPYKVLPVEKYWL